MSILDGLQNISNDKRHYLSQEQNFWIRSYKFGSQSSFHIFHGPFHRGSPVQFQVLNLLDSVIVIVIFVFDRYLGGRRTATLFSFSV